MEKRFKIFTDRLKDGHAETIQEETPSDFLDIHEKELSFPEPVRISGQAYLAENHLVIQLHIETSAELPCSICNSPTKVPIIVDDFYNTEAIEDLRSPIFDYTESLREAILLQLPSFVECSGGNCPERENIKKYLKQPKSQEKEKPSPRVHFPFANLDKQ
jgi:uncharacterized metal-binding protein YceD (DUF177 family)